MCDDRSNKGAPQGLGIDGQIDYNTGRLMSILRSSTRFVLGFVLAVGVAWGSPQEEPFREWSLDDAVRVLNSSAWARQETFTRVVSGVGSGVSGEKEIYNTFYIRFLSARPIREAYARVQQIQHGYDEWSSEERQILDGLTSAGVELDVDDWIVLTVSFRSNDPNEESLVRQFFQSQTSQTLQNKAFLSTGQYSQVRLAAYFPPSEEGVGAKFIFPRRIDGAPVVSEENSQIVFELLEVPGASPQLRSSFVVRDMVLDGELLM